MKIHDVLPKAGRKRPRKRRGRGPGSGLGKTAGRGTKGAKSRSGWKQRDYFEGGQMPLVRRVPKRGFSNAPFRVRYDIVNVSLLEERCEAGETVDLAALERKGAVRPRYGRLKVLGNGEISKKLDVVADKISEAARRKIEAAGGTVRDLSAEREAERKKQKKKKK